MSATGAGEAPADVEAAGLEEGEDHAAADDELVHLGEQRLDHADLGRHLRRRRRRQFGHGQHPPSVRPWPASPDAPGRPRTDE